MSAATATAGTYLQLYNLSGRVAVVTGGVGILGRRCAAALADFGADVAVVDRDEDEAEAFAKELRSAFGRRAAGFGTDLADPGAMAPLADRIESELGSVAILHNNAASKGASIERFFDPPEIFDPSVWREIMAVNLDGAFYVAREFGSRMAARGGGSIIQTASIYGVVGPDQRIYSGSEYLGRRINTPAVYSASKAALVGLTRYFATYWGAAGVRVNTLTPGGVSSGQNAVFEERYSARVPLGRMARADEIAGPLVFLASDASSYVTGQNLIVDGGLTAW